MRWRKEVEVKRRSRLKVKVNKGMNPSIVHLHLFSPPHLSTSP